MTNFPQPKPYQAKLEDRFELNDKYHNYHFELTEPNTMEFLAGQYLSIAVNDQGLRRSYSISSSPDITHGFELLVDVEPSGPGSNFLKNLPLGETISFMGPLGRFVLSQSHNDIVMIATGSGIAPFKSMISQLLQVEQTTRQITLHWGMRRAEQLFWLDEFQILMDAFPNFHFLPVLSKPTPDWTLSRGRVTQVLSAIKPNLDADYYLCGNQEMIAQVSSILATQGVRETQVFYEKFY